MIDDVLRSLDRSRKPLIVCDIDEVVLEFLDPFHDYLMSCQYRLHADSFRLHGNIRRITDGICATDDEVERFQEEFFSTQDKWQRPARDAKAVLDGLEADADIVFLTAMPPRHAVVRRTLLYLHEFRFPMIATEAPKGPVVSRLRGQRNVPVVFIDDMHRNLHSVRNQVPDSLLINLMANENFRRLAPYPGDGVAIARDWRHAETMIRNHLLGVRAFTSHA